MWQQIESNKRKTFFVITFMSIFLILFSISFGIAITDDIASIFVFNIIFYLIFLCMLIYAYKKPLSSFSDNIYEYKGEGDKTLLNIVEEMKIASGLKQMPKIYILDSGILNAFACGTSEKNARIVVSKGLLKTLNRDELQGVVAHEIAHIINKDTAYLLYAGIIVSIVAIFANLATRHMFRNRRSSGGSGVELIGIIIAIIFIIIAPIFANMFYFFLSRKREYLADACSAKFTRNPNGLASALKKISSEIQADNKMETMSELQKMSSPLANASYIVPLKLKSEGDGLFSTHPSTKNRINILLNMANMSRADLEAYNSVYKKVVGSENLINLTGDERQIIKTNENIIKPAVIPDITANPAGQMAGLTASAAILSDNSVATAENKESEIDEEIKNHRNVEDMMWTLAHYVNIDCPCGTKLKIPESYKEKTVICPHCKKLHEIIR